MFKKSQLLLTSFAIMALSCHIKKEVIDVKVLYSGSNPSKIKYWDLQSNTKLNLDFGYGWKFDENGLFDTYYYKNGVRYHTNYYDLDFGDEIKWNYSLDTLFTMNGIFKFELLLLNKDSLVIVDFNGYLRKGDTLSFVPSSDQLSEP